MNPAMQNTLNLRDIHLPDAVSWWPPAIGWWIVLALLLLIIYLTPKIYQRLTFKPLNTVSNQAFEEIVADYRAHDDPLALIQSLSKLLRQISMSYHGREHSAYLTGNEWINSLNELTEENYFTDTLRNTLINGPYQKNTTFQTTNILNATKKWIEALPKKNLASIKGGVR